MFRRGFLKALAGIAGAFLVPWGVQKASVPLHFCHARVLGKSGDWTYVQMIVDDKAYAMVRKGQLEEFVRSVMGRLEGNDFMMDCMEISPYDALNQRHLVKFYYKRVA